MLRWYPAQILNENIFETASLLTGLEADLGDLAQIVHIYIQSYIKSNRKGTLSDGRELKRKLAAYVKLQRG